MSGGELQVLVTFIVCATVIPFLVIGWIRDPWGKAVDKQRKADESAARRQCAPRPRLGIDVSPIRPPTSAFIADDDDVYYEPTPLAVRERVVDVINEGGLRR